MPILARSDNFRRYAARSATPNDDWLSALTKIIPVEVIAAYTAAIKLLQGVEASDMRQMVAWIILAVGAVGTVLYMVATWDPDPAVRRQELPHAWPQLIVSLLAFGFWSFTLGGPFEAFPWYAEWLGGVALIVGAFLLTGINKLIGTFSVAG